MSRARQALGADGALAGQIEGFAARGVQQDMAEAVELALEDGGILIAEAGTGTGKTFAYLVPALQSGQRVVISTGTKNLQDQLFHRDLPRVRDALGQPVRVALLKGRGNYLCIYRMRQAIEQGFRDLPRLTKIDAWSRQTKTGEVADIPDLAVDDPLLPTITSTGDNCLGGRCPDYDKCHVARARRDAQAADVVVVNHHLLFADFMLKEEGFGQILPGADAIIVDEAHQLPDLASQFFGVRVSSRQLSELIRDARVESSAFGDMPDLDQCLSDLAEIVGQNTELWSRLQGRQALEQAQRQWPDLTAALKQLAADLGVAARQLDGFEERSAGLAACARRAKDLAARLNTLLDEESELIRWIEPSFRGGLINATPADVALPFSRLVEAHGQSWVMTSATLSVGENFDHYGKQLGLKDAQTLRVDSPFDYPRQARLYLPPDLPEPNQREFTTAWLEAIWPLIKAADGGSFVLCTSYRAVREAGEWLRERWHHPVLVQGEGSRNEMLDRFAEHGQAVLVGTSSFWEGVDVRGQALRLVVIDKLPFASPGDPVLEARIRSLREAGRNPFMELQLPEAILTLRQGVGRLIRDPQDRGLLVICDPRLKSKFYGRQVLASLPAMPVLHQAEQALAWAQSLHPEQSA